MCLHTDSTPTEAFKQAQQEESKREQQGENMSFSEAVDEHGFVGNTTSMAGEAQRGGYGRIEENVDAGDAGKTRREQGYGKGSGVGA